MLIHKEEQQRTLVQYGRYFGYPDCCIKFFSKRWNQPIAELLKEKPRKLHGSGYIPCDCCNSKTEEELINQINKNRLADSLFEG